MQVYLKMIIKMTKTRIKTPITTIDPEGQPERKGREVCLGTIILGLFGKPIQPPPRAIQPPPTPIHHPIQILQQLALRIQLVANLDTELALPANRVAEAVERVVLVEHDLLLVGEEVLVVEVVGGACGGGLV